MRPVVLIFCGSPKAFQEGVKKLVDALGETPKAVAGNVMLTEERQYALVRSMKSVVGYDRFSTTFAVWEPRPDRDSDRASEEEALRYLHIMGIKEATAFGKSISPLPEVIEP